MTADWLTALVTAANSIDQAEQRHTELAEGQAADLLRWCLGGPDHSGGTGGSNSSYALKCIRCSQPIQYVPPDADSGASTLEYTWTCGDCRGVLRDLVGHESSPGRPGMSASDARIARYRRMSASMRARHQGPAPTPPRMPSSSPPRPSPPTMPVVGP